MRKNTATSLITLTAITTLAAAVLAGCSTSTTGSGGGRTLTIGWNSLDRPGIDAAVAAFKKSHPDVEIKLTSADVADYQALIRTQLSSGTAPDVFYVWPGNGNPGAIEALAPGGYLADLSGRAWVANIPGSIKSRTEVDGTTYFAPMATNGIGAIYNMDLMGKLGIKVPDTWDSVLEYCAKAKAAGKIPYDVGVADIFAIMVPYALVATNVYTTTPDFDAEQAAGKSSFESSPGYKKSLEQEIEMRDAGCFGSVPTGTVLADTVTHIADGSALAVINITTTLGQFTKAAPNTTLKFFPLPATNDPSETRISGSSGAGPAVNAKTGNMELALEFVDWMGSAEGQTAYAGGSKQVPPMSGDLYQPSDLVAEVAKMYKENRVSPLLDQNWPNAVVQERLVSAVQQLMADKSSIGEVLKIMDVAYTTGK
ncbi:ABC transporter substrate-binding protein [Acrocarpospora pleiomorpha]|uniref:ABC transporter substrate-binding protein n=1 Tax=Acrocarpospora pleiomorpha TaxID=90975 RepID=A0A5M3XWG5_9ACTN|nr:extracellular solute-binding protein [Acrocarpospora pleiomorpha]GES23901.1 ABC transporter substrate-binding protein [Acrocarpospora pleiomorpha]